MDDFYFSDQPTSHPLPPMPGMEPDENGEMPRRLQPKKKKKKHTGRRIFVTLLCLILVFAIGAGAVFMGVYSMMSRIDYNSGGHKPNVYVDENALLQSEQVTNILLIGLDRTEESESARSDTMMLLTLDRQNKQIKLTSFMRDTWVDIPDKGYAKLNAACSKGGAQLVMDTIEYNFNIRIDHYMLVDFTTFTKVVDLLGGVDVEITQKEADFLLKTTRIGHQIGKEALYQDMADGKVHFTGEQTLIYCRIRKLDSDFMRTARQRKVISSIIDEAKSQNIRSLADIAKEVLPCIETDMDPLTLTKLAFSAVAFMRYDLEQMQVPVDGTWKNARKNGQAVLELDLRENTEAIAKFVFEKAEPATQPAKS